MQAITFDFHNTLANWPSQFELEVRTLPSSVAFALGIEDSASHDRLTREYRTLREQVIATGNEIDAYQATHLLLTGLGYNHSKAHLDELVDQVMTSAVIDFDPIPGAAEAVRYLHEQRIPLAIISSTIHHRSLEWAVEQMGIADCFQTIVTSASSGFYKSVPAIYDVAFRALGANPGTSLHVGDSLRWDVTGAIRFGTNSAWLRTEHVDRFTQMGPLAEPTFVIESMIGSGPVLANFLSTLAEPVHAS